MLFLAKSQRDRSHCLGLWIDINSQGFVLSRPMSLATQLQDLGSASEGFDWLTSDLPIFVRPLKQNPLLTYQQN